MSNVIRIYETGGPDVLRWEEDDPGQPGAGEALVQHDPAGHPGNGGCRHRGGRR
jgi:NADPH2:quinone reductase